MEGATKRAIVVVVEDHADLRELFEVSLGEAGYDVRAAASVAEARALLATVQPDVLVLDDTLDDGSAADVLALCTGAHPCIVVTGKNTPSVGVDRAAAVLLKPVLPHDLVAAVRRLA